LKSQTVDLLRSWPAGAVGGVAVGVDLGHPKESKKPNTLESPHPSKEEGKEEEQKGVCQIDFGFAKTKRMMTLWG
jgi:hypothetical protein